MTASGHYLRPHRPLSPFARAIASVCFYSVLFCVSVIAQVTPAPASAPAGGIPLGPIAPSPGTAPALPGRMPGSASATTPAAPDIHDIHGLIPLTFWEQHGLQVIVAAVAVVILVGLLTWLLLRKKAKPALTPLERARQELAAAHALLVTGQDKAFAVAVSGAVRHYLENAYRMPAPERTTEEFLQEAARHDWLRGELTVLLRRFLELCDLAKFAGQQYGPAEREQLHAAAAEFVETADRLLHPPNPKDQKNKPSPDVSDDDPPKPTAQDLANSLAKVSRNPS
jgi:hypothetical protein